MKKFLISLAVAIILLIGGMLYLNKNSDSTSLSENTEVDASDFIGVDPTIDISDIVLNLDKVGYTTIVKDRYFVPAGLSDYFEIDYVFCSDTFTSLDENVIYKDMYFLNYGTISDTKLLLEDKNFEYPNRLETISEYSIRDNISYEKWNSDTWKLVQQGSYPGSNLLININEAYSKNIHYTDNTYILDLYIPCDVLFGDFYGELEPIHLKIEYDNVTNECLGYEYTTKSINSINNEYAEISSSVTWEKFDGNFAYDLDTIKSNLAQ